jgi:hypothetical protein
MRSRALCGGITTLRKYRIGWREHVSAQGDWSGLQGSEAVYETYLRDQLDG